MSGLTCKIFVAHMCKMLATRFKMSTTGCKELTTTFRVVDDKLAHVNRSFIPLAPPLHSDDSDLLTGNQLRECPFRWVSPPDPSASHNRCTPLHAKFITAAQLGGFFKGSIFIQYKSTGSSLLGTYYPTTPDRLMFYSGFRCTLVRPFLLHSAFN